jgi:hypothetical protein
MPPSLVVKALFFLWENLHVWSHFFPHFFLGNPHFLRAKSLVSGRPKLAPSTSRVVVDVIVVTVEVVVLVMVVEVT